jgi:hypothetical protein
MADVIWRIIALSRPSLKLGTHSTIRFSIGNEVRFILSKIKKIREKYEKIVTKKATPDSETAVSGFFPQERRARSRKFPQGEKASGGSRGAGKRGGAKGGEDFGKNREIGKIRKIGRDGKPPSKMVRYPAPRFPGCPPCREKRKPRPEKTAGAGSGPE